MFPYEDSEIVSVCPYPEKKKHHSLVNISPRVETDTWMERSLKVLQHENLKFSFQRKSKLSFELYFDFCWTDYCFFNIGSAGVNDARIERFSQKLQHENLGTRFWVAMIFVLIS